jgi:hypothetical protein
MIDLGRHDVVHENAGHPALLPLCTDGPTDAVGDDADRRTGLLEETVARCGPDGGAERLAEAVLAACVPGGLRDDVAVLAVHLAG